MSKEEAIIIAKQAIDELLQYAEDGLNFSMLHF